jgi:hypothetical protein
MRPSKDIFKNVDTEHNYTKNIIKFLGNSVVTLFVTPPHKKLHKKIELYNQSKQQPIQPDISSLNKCILDILLKYHDGIEPKRLSNLELFEYGAVLIQFTQYSPELVTPSLKLSYADIYELKNIIYQQYVLSNKPLNLAEQLEIAMKINNGDLLSSLYMLFVASRTYARWLDEPLIDSGLNSQDKLNQMQEWRESICGFKDTDNNQDPAGDKYYAWTHVLASYVYEVLPQKQNIATKSTERLFKRGTSIMHGIVHKINKQAVPNSHLIASVYGNSIGETINN